jgi:hypothetical protein
MKQKLLFLTLLFTIICFGQNTKVDSLTSKNSNLNWIKRLEEVNTKGDKLKVIIEKIKTDSIISQSDIIEKIVINVNDGENVNDAINKKTKCKIVFVLIQGKVGHLLDLNQYPNYSVALKYLTEETIDSIEILKDEKATSLYGSRAICGVVEMKSNNRKLKKLIRKSFRK